MQKDEFIITKHNQQHKKCFKGKMGQWILWWIISTAQIIRFFKEDKNKSYSLIWKKWTKDLRNIGWNWRSNS